MLEVLRTTRTRPRHAAAEATSLTVDALAAFRLTRLIVTDDVFGVPRSSVKSWLLEHDHPRLYDLIGCPWCVSVYVGAGVVAARTVAPRVWHPLACALAFSAVTGALAEAT